MAWNPSPVIGNANWFGNPQIATLSQLNSSIGYTSTVSNVLQTEISSIVAGGTTSLWANYKAISNIDVNSCNINNVTTINAVFLSSCDLQVSSINGNDMNFFGSTITLAGVTIVNNSIVTQNVTQNRSAFDTFVDVVNGIGSMVNTVQEAVGGFLKNTGAAAWDVYWAVTTAGAVVDTAKKTVQLVTGLQGAIDSRQMNSISGGNVPGQTNLVYETFNGNIQFQFSTLGTPTYTVFRTTDQANPNMSFGSEIFRSTIISSGVKCVRSVGDPLNIPFMSTALISSSAFLQAFGQWTPILDPDQSLFANRRNSKSCWQCACRRRS